MDFSVDSLEGGERPNFALSPSVNKQQSRPATLPPNSPAPTTPSTPTSSKCALSEAGSQRLSLSPWEDWMVRKTREDHQRRRSEKMEVEERQRMEEQRIHEQAEKQRKSHEEYLRWARRKQAKKMAAEARPRPASKEQAQGKRPTDDQLREQFRSWCSMKQEKEAAARREEEERQKREVQMAQERKDRAELAYRAWLERAGHPTPPRLPPGARQRLVVPLTSPPSFCNPRPWAGPLDN